MKNCIERPLIKGGGGGGGGGGVHPDLLWNLVGRGPQLPTGARDAATPICGPIFGSIMSNHLNSKHARKLYL